MNWSAIFISYISLNLAIVAAVTTLTIWFHLFSKLSYSQRLKLHYIAFLAVILSPTLRGPSVQPSLVKIWSQESVGADRSVSYPAARIDIKGHSVPLQVDYVFLFIIGIGAGAIAYGIWQMMVSSLALWQESRRSHLIRSIGRVRVLVTSSARIPYAYRSLRLSYVVVPEYLLSNSHHLKLAISHEIQHHKQRDTSWAYPLSLLRALCFFNPFIHFWMTSITETQELACDEALIGRQRYRAQDCARCLIEVAEQALDHLSMPNGAFGMACLSQGSLLNRRIKIMFRRKNSKDGFGMATGLIAVLFMTATAAFAAKGLIQDRRVTMELAQSWARTARAENGFPVVINQEVLQQLNQFVGTPEGRQFMRQGLKRMELYRPMIEAKMSEYKVPRELLAIPLIESGYQNLEESNRQGWGAGLWMFIASTARAYGLKVGGEIDERLNEGVLTDAAMRYLSANNLRFQDWWLAALAYNAGEVNLQKEMGRLGSRDAWKIVRSGNLGRESKEYLSKLIAAIIVMNNPSAIE